ncbi:MAG: hypothetical protein ACRDRI_10560 [Pseudonocardiaceae bacterium]
MPEKVVKDNVLCYVVRDGRLLVFRHTDYSYEEVSIQVPAGSVRPGETEYDISPYRFEVQRRHVFHLELTEPTPERWASQEDHAGESGPTQFECFWVPLEGTDAQPHRHR